jgi:glycosyltransferase involved in cell wall biosynthesis
MEAAIATPTVSVLMPTYKQAVFLARALESLQAQTLQDWELIILNDGSPDDTEAVVAPYLEDNRIQYHRWERNQGIGAALNHLTQLARGRYIAYLPSDDVYYPEHLARLTSVLDAQPDSYLAYGCVRYAYNSYGRTPHSEIAASDEQSPWFAMVQVVHRRELEGTVRWTPRTERVTNTIELEFWQGLFDQGARSCFVDELTSEWLQHRFQHSQAHGRAARWSFALPCLLQHRTRRVLEVAANQRGCAG